MVLFEEISNIIFMSLPGIAHRQVARIYFFNNSKRVLFKNLTAPAMDK
jgi:hypothetical protein